MKVIKYYSGTNRKYYLQGTYLSLGEAAKLCASGEAIIVDSKTRENITRKALGLYVTRQDMLTLEQAKEIINASESSNVKQDTVRQTNGLESDTPHSIFESNCPF